MPIVITIIWSSAKASGFFYRMFAVTTYWLRIANFVLQINDLQFFSIHNTVKNKFIILLHYIHNTT